MKRVLLVSVLAAAALVACRGERARASLLSGDTRQTISVDGRSRSYWVHVPSSGARAGLPVVFLLHGGTGSAEGMERIAHFNKVADGHSVLAVYPEGWRRSWNDGRPNTPAAQAGVDDVKFISMLIDKLTARNGPLEQLADVADTLARLAPGMEALEPAIATLQDAVMSLTMVVNPLSNIADRIPFPRRRPRSSRSATRPVPSQRVIDADE